MTSSGTTIIAACNAARACMNAFRSRTPDSARRSAVPISHSLRSTLNTASAELLKRFFSSRFRTPHNALKYGIMFGARNIALPRGKAMFLAPNMIPYFNALWGVRKREEKKRLSSSALAVLRVLRKEWEMGTADLRAESGVRDRKAFMQALAALQAAMIVVPDDVIYEPKFTYLWGLAEERFPEQLSRKVDRRIALREIARCFLAAAGMTIPGELARVTGLSRPDAGLGNRALVAEGYAVMLAPGTYQLARTSRTTVSM